MREATQIKEAIKDLLDDVIFFVAVGTTNIPFFFFFPSVPTTFIPYERAIEARVTYSPTKSYYYYFFLIANEIFRSSPTIPSI